jgi:hypothetical protein
VNYKTDWSIINDLVSEFDQYIKEHYKQYSEIEVYSFPQGWGSTALGYGGIGGQAMTSAQTIVLYDVYQGVVRVYFGGKKLAYQIENPNKLFFEDLSRWQLKEVSRAGAYRRKDTDIYGNEISK